MVMFIVIGILRYVLPWIIPFLVLRSWLKVINNNVITANKKLEEIEGRIKKLEEASDIVTPQI